MVSGVVRAMWQTTWRRGISRVRKREGRGFGVAGLLFELGPVYGAAVQAGWGSGLVAELAEAEALEGFAEHDAGGLTAAAGGVTLLAAVDEAVEEGSGGDDGGCGVDLAAIAEVEAADGAGWGLFDEKANDLCLLEEEVGLGFEVLLHADAVEGFVALGARAPDGGAAAGVEETELDADGVCDEAHDAAEGVDFTDEVALGDAADGGVAGHLGDEIEIEGEESRAETHAGGCRGRLRSQRGRRRRRLCRIAR